MYICYMFIYIYWIYDISIYWYSDILINWYIDILICWCKVALGSPIRSTAGSVGGYVPVLCTYMYICEWSLLCIPRTFGVRLLNKKRKANVHIYMYMYTYIWKDLSCLSASLSLSLSPSLPPSLSLSPSLFLSFSLPYRSGGPIQSPRLSAKHRENSSRTLCSTPLLWNPSLLPSLHNRTSTLL